jgi:glycosyltransferase involved in cell wall biosynthesis/GT2 family glycosyltransferase
MISSPDLTNRSERGSEYLGSLNEISVPPRNNNLQILSASSGFGGRAQFRTVPCRPTVPNIGSLVPSEFYRSAACYARKTHLRVMTIGEIDPRGVRILCAEMPSNLIEVSVAPEVADYFTHVEGLRVHACDPSYEHDLRGLKEGPLSDGPAVMVVPLVLERISDPRPLLRTLRQVLVTEPQSRVFLATADRATLHGDDYLGPPVDPMRIREWSRSELREFLCAGGFTIEEEKRFEDGTVLFVLKCEAKAYAAYLAAHCLPSPSIRYLLVSTEHSACRTTGGIGSYCAQMERRFSIDELGFLYVGTPADLTLERTNIHWLIASELLGAVRFTNLTAAEVVHEVLPIVLFLYPEIRTIEGPDYQGLCALAIQARQAGFLPQDLTFVTRCHGAQTYLEHCFQSWQPAATLATTYLERLALENADVVSFLTRFLERLYDVQGYRIPVERRQIVPYPFDFADAAPATQYEPIDTIVFFGKRTRMKGFPLFVEALRMLINDRALGRVRRVVVIGPIIGSPSESDAALAELRGHIVIEEREGSNSQVLAWLRAEAPRALVVLPYRGDNFPVSIPEAIACGCQILAARAGGIPEMIADELADELLHDNDAASLAAAIRRTFCLNRDERNDLVRRSLHAMRTRFEAPSRIVESGQQVKVQECSTIGVIVPCYVTPFNYLEDLLLGLHNQSRPVNQVVFVDDGSPTDYVSNLKQFLAARVQVPWRLLQHATNRGLSAARNSGLRALDTDYVINLDSDDIPRSDFLRRYVDYLDSDRSVVAVTSWLSRFFDGEEFQSSDNCVLIYRPLGTGLALALSENCLGHANSAFRRQQLIELGGWDEFDRSMWEDYALFLRLLSIGKRIGVVPCSELLYRVRPQSMARNSPQFPAEERLARNLEALPRFDALRLEGLVRTLRADIARLKTDKKRPEICFMEELKMLIKRIIRER